MATLDTMLMPLNNYPATISPLNTNNQLNINAQLNIFNQLNVKADILTEIMTDAGGSTDKFNEKLEATGANADTASNKLGKFLDITKLVNGAVKGMKIADKFININTRLKLANDGSQTQPEFQDKIFQAANRSRGSYMDMASTVATLGSIAKDAFPTNDEAIAFSELLQKSMKVSGVSGAEQSTTMGQVAQTMGKGTLTSGDFSSITDQVPAIMEALITATGKSEEELKGLASTGLMTADFIKNAMFIASDQINEQFDSMDVTFAEICNRIKNEVFYAFQPIIEAVSELIKSAAFNDILDSIIIGINILSLFVNEIIDCVITNWPIIESILLAIGIFLVFQLIGYLTAAIPVLLTNVALWWAMNAPIVAVIATIAAIIYMLQSMGVTFEDIFSFIGGVIGVFVGFFANIFITLWNIVADFVNFFGNIFSNPIESIIALFADLAITVLGFIEGIAKGIENLLNHIPGIKVDITSGLTGLKDGIAAKSGKFKSEADLKTFMEKKEYLDYTEAAATGGNIGKKAYGNLDSTLSNITNSFTGIGTGKEYEIDISDYGTSGNPLTVKGTGRNDSMEVDVSDEDLGYLRDIAEREYINKFSTATLAPQIQVQFGDVHQEADADKVAGRIKMILQEEIATAAEGAY